MTLFKMCGMMRPHDASLAVELGASHIGAIFAQSVRRVSLDSAIDIFDAVRQDARCVGVFDSTSSPAEIAATAVGCGVDIVQLHGSASPADIRTIRHSFDGQIWYVIGVDPASHSLPVIEADLYEVVDGLLIDSRVNGHTGGTGVSTRWADIAPDVSRLALRRPIILAGGLNPSNVTRAISTLDPAIVDVSSGVETRPGVKDPDLMRAFAEAVSSASIE